MPRPYGLWIILLTTRLSGAVCEALSPPVRELTYYEDALSWLDAAKVCQDNGGHLIKVDNPEVLQALHIFYVSEAQAKWQYTWIGLFYENKQESFFWEDCSNVNFSMLGSSKPQTDKECVELHPGDIKRNKDWNEAECQRTNPFICERNSGRCQKFVEYDSWRSNISVSDPRPAICTVSGGWGIPRDDCEARCLEASATAQCYGYSYGEADTQCQLHYAESATALWFSENINRTLPLFILFCFEFSLGSRSFGSSEEVSMPSCSPVSTKISSINFTCPENNYTTMETSTSEMTTELTSLNTGAARITTAICICACPNRSIASNFTTHEKQEMMTSILQALTPNTKNLSATVRKYSSATDNRSSSQTLGAFATVLITFTFGSIVILDAIKVVIWAKAKLLKSSIKK